MERSSYRRKFLASIGSVLTVLSGCSALSGEVPNNSDTVKPSPTPTPSSIRKPTKTSTRTNIETPTETETDSGSPTPEETATDSPTPTETESVELDPVLFSESPSSGLAPTEGFADGNWLELHSLELVRVTNLDNHGEGSLRWAVNKTHPRLIVFEVGGVIDLAGERLSFNEENGEVVIAGQTAPNPGITLIKDGVYVGASNVIIQHLRFRPGTDVIGDQESPGNEGYSTDAMVVGGTTVGNVIIDHCSFTWASDEILSSSGRDSTESNPFTFANSIIAEGLRNTDLHPEDNHSFGSLFTGGHNTSVYGNLYANNQSRNPFIGSSTGLSGHVINNMIFNCGGTIQVDLRGENEISIIGNRATSTDPIDFNNRTPDDLSDKMYLSDNLGPKEPLPLEGEDIDSIEFVNEPPTNQEQINPVPASDVEALISQSVGARPAERVRHDARIIDQLKKRNGEIIDNQNEVGGYPKSDPEKRALKVPKGPDVQNSWLYQHTKAVELVDEDPPS